MGKGRVVSQQPAAGKVLSVNAKIQLVVSKGKKPKPRRRR
jgi:beta-lactam-binding protein with PASTA domain